MDFSILQEAIFLQFTEMAEQPLYLTDVSKDDMWNTYLDSFPEGTNPIYRERTEHDCQCCKQFIRTAGNVVSIVNHKLISIWDVEVGGYYQIVADAMSAFVKTQAICDQFLSDEKKLGHEVTYQIITDSEKITWRHFYFELPAKHVHTGSNSFESKQAKLRANKEVFLRGCEEITLDAIDTVLELIDQGSLYRGDEYKTSILNFKKYKKQYDKIARNKRDNFCWLTSQKLGAQSKIRNTAIGTLLTNISIDIPLEAAVGKFESIMAPTNYKRPKALITARMIKNAQTTIAELGIESSLGRRFAVVEDLTINNVLFADRTAKKAMDVFDELIQETPLTMKTLGKVEEIDIDTFLTSILPQISSIDLMLENQHENNLVSLIAPQNKEASGLFSWNNNFSWAYNGEVADSMKERVAKAGGNITGDLRFSIQWNDGDNNQNDFDAHCIEPNGNLIYYSNARVIHPSSGMLDVDIIDPGNKIAVENIVWTDKRKMPVGIYKMIVHNFRHHGGRTGFTAQIEFNGQIHNFAYNKELKNQQKVRVAIIHYDGTDFKIIESLPTELNSKKIWDISTYQLAKVSLVMKSPNYWDGQNPRGNNHTFFMLENCINPNQPRGFFNEFLKSDFHKHRKVFEILGSKMQVEASANQLSGVGFSSSQRNSILCKVTGNFTRTLKIFF